MIVNVEINPELYSEILKLVRGGRYLSPEQFAQLALQNQLVLERTHSAEPSTKPSDSGGSTPAVRRTQTDDAVGFLSRVTLHTPTAPDIEPVSPDKLLWGGISRFAPVKLVLRVLANLVHREASTWVDYKLLTGTVSEVATKARRSLDQYDERHWKTRGLGFSTGFPTRDPSSQDRFVNQYVGRRRSDGQLEGLSPELGLISITESPEHLLVAGLTETGNQLASLESPLIDDLLMRDREIASAWSVEERRLILEVLNRAKPAELKFLCHVYEGISRGVNSTGQLTTYVREYLQRVPPGFRVTDKVITTTRVGATGKLIDLGFISIQRKEQRTTYVPIQENADLLLATVTSG